MISKKIVLTALTLAIMQPAVAMEQDKSPMKDHFNNKLKRFCESGNVLDTPDEQVLAKITKYLDKGASPDIVFRASINGASFTLLSYAILVQNSALACLLLNKGANPNLRLTHYGSYSTHTSPYPLVTAAELNLTQVCVLLLEKGAYTAAEDESGWGFANNGMTALKWAEKNNNAELVALLRDRYGAHLFAPKKKNCCETWCSIQ